MLDALLFQLGYNASLVTLGTLLLGIASGLAGTFLFLRKRALVSDAVSHATLPGIGLAFMLAVSFGGDGRNLVLLLIGATASAWLGLLCVSWLTRHTRLGEDAAIGAVLSVFFGCGVVLLTVIQSMQAGTQAGLEGFLLGSTAGMLRNEALTLALAAAVVLGIVLLMRRPFTLAAFDPEYAQTQGYNLPRIDMAMMGVVLAVTVVGLKVVGLILIVALLIIPPVVARFWTDRVGIMLALSGAVGGLSGYVGAALSASQPNLPTGPIVVLICFAIFVLSLVLSPLRGIVASIRTQLRYRHQVHIRQGLLALAQNQPIYEAFTRRLLQRAGLARPDGVATDTGRALAAKALRDEHRWAVLRADPAYASAAARYDGLTEIETVLTPDQITVLDTRIDKGVPV